jgi:hypothetical protein
MTVAEVDFELDWALRWRIPSVSSQPFSVQLFYGDTIPGNARRRPGDAFSRGGADIGVYVCATVTAV